MFIPAFIIYFELLWQLTTGIITGRLDPVGQSYVGEDDTVEFTCTVTGRDKQNQYLHWQIFNTLSRDSTFFLANMTRNVSRNEIQTEGIHGNYRISYAEENSQEVLKLRIVNVTKLDGILTFNCAYTRTNEPSIFLDRPFHLGAWITLTVLTQPECSFVPLLPQHIPSLISTNSLYRIALICQTEQTEALSVSWYTTENERKMEISASQIHTNTLQTDIDAGDHGREYTCEALTDQSPGLVLTCSVIPYDPRPELTVTSDTSMIKDGEGLIVYCTNTGAFPPDTRYLWYINNVLLNDLEDEMIKLAQAQYNSTLSLGYSFLPSENVKITCEGTIPGIVSANASVIVNVERKMYSESPATTLVTELVTPTEPDSQMLVVIIATASAGGLFLIIILLILIRCCCLRRRLVDSKTGQQSLEPPTVTVDSLTVEKNRSHSGYQNPGPANATKLPSQNQPQSGSPLHNGIPIYAKPNKAGSLKNTTEKLKVERKLSHYEDVGEQLDGSSRDQSNKSSAHKNSFYEGMPSEYDAVSVPTDKANILCQNAPSKRSANVEGLMYADLEISNVRNSNGVDNSRSVTGNDNLTVYSEVKM